MGSIRHACVAVEVGVSESMLRWRASLWVPKLGDLLILVEQSAESVAPADVVGLGCCVAAERS